MVRRLFNQLIALMLAASVPALSFGEIGHDYVEPDAVVVDPTNCTQAITLGREVADDQHSSTGWLVGGVAAGVMTGLIGTGVATIIAATTDPTPKQVDESVNQACYLKGYSGKARNENITNALGGGLLGTAVFVVAYLVISDNSDD